MWVSRLLNAAIIALLVALGTLLVGPRLGSIAAAPPEPPGLEELHRAALATLERFGANAADVPAAFERARAAAGDPRAAGLYAQAIEHLTTGRPDLAEAAFAEALRAEREVWLDR